MIAALSIKSRAALASTILFLVLIALMTAVSMLRLTGQIQELLSAQQSTLVSTIADDIDQKFNVRLGYLTKMASAVAALNFQDAEKIQSRFADKAEVLALFDDFFVFSAHGEVLMDLPQTAGRRGTDISDRAYFKVTMSSGKPMISPPFQGRASGQPTIILTAPILNKRGEIVAMLGGSYNLLKDNFLGIIGNTKVGKTGYFYIVTKTSPPVVVMHQIKSRIMQTSPNANGNTSLLRALNGFEGTLEGTNSRNLRALFSFKSLKATDWLLAAVLPVEEAYAPVRDAERALLLDVLIICACTGPLIWLVTYRLLAPLGELRKKIRHLREHPDAGGAIPVVRLDEIGELTKDFNEMMTARLHAEAALRHSQKELRTVADNVPVLIAYVDQDKRYRFSNRTYWIWLGISPESMLGHTVREIIGVKAYSEVEPNIKQALSGQRITFDWQVTSREDGTTRLLRFTYLPDFAEGGKVSGFYVLASEIPAPASMA